MAASNQSKFKHIIGAPIRILNKISNLYKNSLMDCASRVDYSGPAVGGPTARVPTQLLKSFSVNSSANDHELQCTSLSRSVSRTDPRREVKKLGTASKIQPANAMQSNYAMGMRSYSVGVGVIGRIDEDKCCSFEEDKGDFLHPKCRSYASKRKVMYY
ncbi:hypothetical protein ACJRO7_034595 [Eucalyptus globulus]|uniref:Uncharacterized protein n=1 Tax=Eucalyptus globulus TaxID=34317 RepID=A0ABD3JDT9_EUCGL